MDTPSDRDVTLAVGELLDALTKNRSEMDQLVRERRRMIHEAHTVGATWAQIAQALGVSRQAVWDLKDRRTADPRATQR